MSAAASSATVALHVPGYELPHFRPRPLGRCLYGEPLHDPGVDDPLEVQVAVSQFAGVVLRGSEAVAITQPVERLRDDVWDTVLDVPDCGPRPEFAT